MSDDHTEDRREYDASVTSAYCPKCGCELAYLGPDDDYCYWCTRCGFVDGLVEKALDRRRE